MNDNLTSHSENARYSLGLSTSQRRWLYVVLAIPMALLGADSFARAAGFPEVSQGYPPQEVLLRILAGVSVGFIALAIMVLMRVSMLHVLHYLGSVQSRPHMAVSITLLVCGTLCILGMLYFEYRIVAHSASFAVSSSQMNMNSAQVSFRIHVPLFVHLISICAFLSGGALLSLGVWSSANAHAPASEISDSQRVDAPPHD